MENNEIFKYLDPNGNSKLSNLSGLDLLELLMLIDKYYLVYRKKLGFNKEYTFGFEIEFSHANFDNIENSLDNYGLLKNWKTTTDSSLNEGMEKSSLDNIIHTLLTSVDRYSAVEFQNVNKKHLDKYKKHNTIEFRAANGTIDPVIWQNNLNMLMNVLMYSKSSKYNLDIIENRRINTEYKYELYDEIYLEQALEFCDLVFNNNYDKVYFLKQYLKSFEFQDYKKEYSKAKKITK